MIGVARSELKTTNHPPPNGRHSLREATLEIYPEYGLGLMGLDKLRQVMVLYWLHTADREVLRVYPARRSKPGNDRRVL